MRYGSAFRQKILVGFLFLFFSGGYNLFLLSQGTFDLQRQYTLSLLFLDMWERLLNFDISIDSKLIGEEGFDVNGVITTYFLPFPSLIRGILNVFNLGSSSTLSLVFCASIFSCTSVLLWNLIYSKRQKDNGSSLSIYWIIGVALCTLLSPMVPLMTYPSVFWEAIFWASTLFLLCCYLSIIILIDQTNQSKLIIIFSIVCGFSLFTRATFAFATSVLFFVTIFQMVILKRRDKNNISSDSLGYTKIALSIAIFMLFILCLLFLNYAKWGNPFEFYPLQYYKMWENADKENFSIGTALDIMRIPQTFAYYFIPTQNNFSASAPFLHLSSAEQSLGMKVFDYKEPSLPITLMQPLFVGLAFFGVLLLPIKILKARELLSFSIAPSVIAALIPILFILCIHSLSIRYIGDFLSAVVILSMYGLSSVADFISRYSISIRHRGSIFISHIYLFTGVLVAIFFVASLYLGIASIFLQNEYWRDPKIQSLNIGEVKKFSYRAIGSPIRLASGWSHDLESFGVWSDSNEASFYFYPPKDLSNKNYLTIKATGYSGPANGSVLVKIYINGLYDQTVNLKSGRLDIIKIKLLRWGSLDTLSIASIGKTLYYHMVNFFGTSNYEPFTVKFHVLNPSRPNENGSSADNRLLGIGLISSEID